jgi:flagellar hook-associated protein 1 FlgK
MVTFGSIFSVVRSAIASSQAAMQVASHNVANAESDGYSRQRVDLTPRAPQLLPFGSLGTGVDIANVTRARDAALDSSFRRESSSAESFGVRLDFLRQIEDVVNEPSDSGIAATLDRFWNAWSDLANNPASTSARAVLRQQGVSVASLFSTLTRQLDDLGANAREQLGHVLTQVNQHARGVADLNSRILAAEASGNQAPDLRDSRDRLLDSLATSGVARTEIQSNGTVNVHLGGLALVSGSSVKTLEVRLNAGMLGVGIVGDPDPAAATSGSMAALIDFVNIDLRDFRNRLDGLAAAVVNGVNEYHASGWSAAGDSLGASNWNVSTLPNGSRVDFFDPAGTSAATIRLSSAVAADVNTIAAGDVPNAPGNDTVARAIAALRDSAGMAALSARMGGAFASAVGLGPNVSYAESWRDTVAGVGIAAMRSDYSLEDHATLASNADQRRLSVSGVSIDEELTKLMQYQQYYVAATRVIRAVDEMADALLSMV